VTARVDKSGERVRNMFGEISPRYDFLNHVLSGGTDRYWRWQTVRNVPPTGTAPILDLCTGTGDLAIAYWKTGRGKVPVVGADFTHEMLTLARGKCRKLTSKRRYRGASPPSLIEADAMALPFADGVFQIVSVAFGLRNIADTERGLREMVRVCRPGGRVAVLEFSLPKNRLIRGIYSCYFRHVLPRLGQLVSRSRHAAYSYLPASVSDFASGEQLAETMRTAGLCEVHFKPLTFGIATLYIGRNAE